MDDHLTAFVGRQLADTPMPTRLRQGFRLVDTLLARGQERLVIRARSWDELVGWVREGHEIERTTRLQGERWARAMTVASAFRDSLEWLTVALLVRRTGLADRRVREALRDLADRGFAQRRGVSPGRWRLTAFI